MPRWNFLRGGIRGGRGPMDEPPAQVTTFGGIAQERPYVGVFPQEAPDAKQKQGLIPSRPARWPIAILTGWNPDAVAEGRFTTAIVSPHPRASYPRTRMTPDYPRANMRVPPHVAYGSLFIAAGPPQQGLLPGGIRPNTPGAQLHHWR